MHDEDARIALFGTCPEVVRVENCLKWHQMKHVSIEIPRVVHQEDVQIRKVHVTGRAHHYVCGVTAVQNQNTRTYRLSKLERSSFCMYPEERLGMELNSPSMMWEHIEDIFTKIRQCMNAGRQGTCSATTSLPVLCTVYHFWQVLHSYLFFTSLWIVTYHQCVGGQPDRLRRTLGVVKERRCDATFAYQQIMVDVHREVLDYTSRYVPNRILHADTGITRANVQPSGHTQSALDTTSM